MAIWQWDVWIVPAETVSDLFETRPTYMDLEWFESVDWWKATPPAAVKKFFDSLLPHYHAPWAKNTDSWGSDDGDRVELTSENGRISGVFIRIDLRDLDAKFLASLVQFAAANDYLFYTLESSKFIAPDLSNLVNQIFESRKMSFLNDPEAFFLNNKKYFEAINKENLRRASEMRDKLRPIPEE